MHHGSGFCNGLFSCFVILRVFAGGEGRVFWGRYGGIIHNIHDKKIIDVLLHTHIDFTVNLIISIAGLAEENKKALVNTRTFESG